MFTYALTSLNRDGQVDGVGECCALITTFSSLFFLLSVFRKRHRVNS